MSFFIFTFACKMFYLRRKFAEQFAIFSGTDRIDISDTGTFSSSRASIRSCI